MAVTPPAPCHHPPGGVGVPAVPPAARDAQGQGKGLRAPWGRRRRHAARWLIPQPGGEPGPPLRGLAERSLPSTGGLFLTRWPQEAAVPVAGQERGTRRAPPRHVAPGPCWGEASARSRWLGDSRQRTCGDQLSCLLHLTRGIYLCVSLPAAG